MPNVFDYLDYRKFLNDFYQKKKTANTNFSFRVFSNKAGFKSKSFLKDVITGRKNLTLSSLEKANQVLNLQGSAFNYMEDLVSFATVKTHNQKNLYFQKLLSYKKSSPHKRILKNQFEFYSQWYHNTIREILPIIDFADDHKRLGKMIKPSLTAHQVTTSIKLLLDLGLIDKSESGYRQINQAITTGDEVASTAVYNFHTQNMEIMKGALDNWDAEKRDISSLIMALSQEGFEKIKKRVQVFRKELMQVAMDDKGKDQVFHVNFQIAPTTERMEES